MSTYNFYKVASIGGLILAVIAVVYLFSIGDVDYALTMLGICIFVVAGLFFGSWARKRRGGGV